VTPATTSLDPAVSGRRRKGVQRDFRSKSGKFIEHPGAIRACRTAASANFLNQSGEFFVHIVAADVGAMLLATFEVILNAFFAKCKQIARREISRIQRSSA
jgi:hypothetical protein